MKIDKLIEKTTEKDGVKKWKVVVGIIVGLALVSGMVVGINTYADVDGYLKTKGIVQLYDFYDMKVGEEETAVYILGDSFVGYSIYSPLLNQQLTERGYNITEYNLGLGNSRPLTYAIQVQNIVDSKPSLVIIGVSYRTLSNWDNWIEEYVTLVNDRLRIRPDSLYLYTETEMEDINPGLSFWYSKKFIESALEYKKSHPVKSQEVKKYNNYLGLTGIRASMQHSYEEIVAAAQNPNNSFRAEITSESTQNKEALLYIIQVLKENDIPVIIINAPLHPVLSENISESSRENLHHFLDSTGVTWYDMELSMGEEYFVDIYHLNGDGAAIFTPYVTDMIIQEMS